MIEVKNTLNGKLNATIIKEYPELEEITVTPTLDGQELKPSKYGYSKIKIEGIPATDVTVSPREEEQNLQGIFKEVKVAPILTEEITADLDFSSGDAIELTAQEGAYIKKATINKDANLSPENIKSGVTIAGISGDVADTSDADATSDDIVVGKTAYVANEKVQGTYVPLDTSDATATAEDIAKDKTAYVNGEKVTGTAEISEYNALMATTISTVGSTTSAVSRYIKNLPNDLEISGTSCNGLFYGCSSLTTVPLFDTSKITIMQYMFNGCIALTTVPLFDTSNVTNTQFMFAGCRSLQTVPLFNTNNLSNMYNMFYNCSSLTTVPLFDTSNVTTAEGVFNGCNSLQTVPTFNLSSATSLKLMFNGCTNLSDESLNNILAMCITATKSSSKTLDFLGLTYEQKTKCKTLSNYQAFLDAGWTTGY